MIPKFTGAVEKGKLSLDYQESFTNYYKTLEGKRIQLVLQEFKKDRSGNQNRYYHGIVVKLIADEMGHEKQEHEYVHQFIAKKFLSKKVIVNGEEMLFVPSTTSLKTDEFEKFLSEVRMWASKELSCYIPLPNEYSY